MDRRAAARRRSGPVPTVRVWDRFVRFFHWSLVASFFGAWLSRDDLRNLHEWLGWLALGLVAARIVWGFVGRGAARFDHFVPRPATLRAYLLAMRRGREPRHLGHNPAAAVMILFLLAAVVGIGGTGWMMTLDRWWGVEWVEELHEGLVELTLIAVALHVAAAVFESWRHRENLILAMFTGRKRAGPEAADPAASDRS